MLAFNKALSWLLISSSDPEAVALTIRGLLVAVLPAIISVLGLAHLNVGQDQATELVDAFVNLVTALLTVVGTALTLVGAVRKVWNSVFPQYAF
jgi:hypothetical protein